MERQFQLDEYLKRINFQGKIEASLTTLESLHHAHLYLGLRPGRFWPGPMLPEVHLGGATSWNWSPLTAISGWLMWGLAEIPPAWLFP